jgi:methylmalonyl-CoA carboxyltransferase 1.3S subunit
LKLQIVIDGKTYEVEYDTTDENSSPSVRSTAQVQSIVLPTPHGPASSAPDADESKICRSPVAGIVTRLVVEAGQSVEAGDILLVVEAMKMENNLASAGAAKVRSITVKVGDSVKAGQIVVEFE